MISLFESYFNNEDRGIDELGRSIKEHDNSEYTNQYVNALKSFDRIYDDMFTFTDRFLSTLPREVVDYIKSEPEYFASVASQINGWDKATNADIITAVNNYSNTDDGSIM